MKRQLLLVLLIIAAIIACEKVYVPDLEEGMDTLVVEAVLLSDQTENDIYLYKARMFDDLSDKYPVVSGAEISLVDNLGNVVQLNETEKGTYHLSAELNPECRYQLNIKYNGEEYLSSLQVVPDPPSIDTVYAAFESRLGYSGAVESTENEKNAIVLQLYTDVYKKNNSKYYRFGGKRTLEFMTYYDTIIAGIVTAMPVWGWRTYNTAGGFNIAGPPNYSTSEDIVKHELEYFNKDYYTLIADSMAFIGWIYRIDQYGISEDAFNYYSDINDQLEAKGRIFDPVYIQMEGNIRCKSNQSIPVLGNFEIESHKEYRYFIRYSRVTDLIEIKEVKQFNYIPDKNGFRKKKPSFWED